MIVNRKVIGFARNNVVITRRFLDRATGRMRVRVAIEDLVGNLVVETHKDFDDMHEGDAAFGKQIRHYEALQRKTGGRATLGDDPRTALPGSGS
jgi:hypothetical protein